MSVYPSEWLHPIRYLRTRPFARRLLREYESRVGRRPLRVSDMQFFLDRILPAYNEGIMRVPFDERPRGSDLLNSEISLLTHVGTFTTFGRNIFALSPEMVYLLDRTDLESVHLGDLTLPYDALCLSFGDQFEASLPGAPNQIDGAYVHRLTPNAIQVTLTSRRLDVGRRPDRKWPLAGEPTFNTLLEGAPEESIATCLRRIVEEQREEIEQLGARQVTHEFETPSGTVSVREGDPDLTAARLERLAQGLPAVQRAIALAMNALCYLTSVPEAARPGYPADAPAHLIAKLEGPKREKQKAHARLMEGGYLPLRIVPGPSGPEHDPAAAPSSESGREISTHWRRGHWRRQRHGTGLQQVRLLWIRPVLVRGDKGEPEHGHLYLVGDPPGS
jgi:hypothetical protein